MTTDLTARLPAPPAGSARAVEGERRPELSRGQTAALIVALMTGLFLSAIDGTAVSTALPTIIGQLGGLPLYTWVFSAYLLTSTTTVPLYGKLADLYGRKRLYLFGVVVFVGGSVLCGLAQSMEQLIAFRALQGLGAGALLPISMTIIGDTFSVQQRANIQGFFGSVWGISAILGPALGGIMTDVFSWRWLFFINLPLGIATVVLIALALHEKLEPRQRSIDYVGALLISGAIASLLGATFAAGQPQGLANPPFWLLLIVTLACGAGYVWNQARVPEPIIPLRIVGHPLIGPAALVTFLAGTAMYGFTSFVPLFAQGVLGGSATLAGAVVAPMSLFWPVGSFINSRLLIPWGYARVSILGGSLLVLGGSVAAFIAPQNGVVVAIVAGSIFGLGMGFINPTVTIAAQNAVPWRERGVATALMAFSRTIGGSLGVTVMGVVLTTQLLAAIPAGTPGLGEGADLGRANVLLDPAQRAVLAPETLATLQQALMSALGSVFVLTAVFAVVTFGGVLLFVRGVRRSGSRPDTPPPA